MELSWVALAATEIVLLQSSISKDYNMTPWPGKRKILLLDILPMKLVFDPHLSQLDDYNIMYILIK